jgi:hypothetical protein
MASFEELNMAISQQISHFWNALSRIGVETWGLSHLLMRLEITLNAHLISQL